MRVYVFKSKYHDDIHVCEDDTMGVIGFIMVELSQMDPEDVLAIECYDDDYGKEGVNNNTES